MNFYALWPVHQTRASWVLCTADKPARKAKPLQPVASTVQTFFGARPEASLRFKPQYQSLRCALCRRFDSDKVFEIGFDADCHIKIKGDFGFTFDRMFLISQKFLDTLQAGVVAGYQTKPIGNSGWHAFHVNRFVDSNPAVITTSGPICPECGRPEDSGGVYQRMSDLSLPSEPNTFFTPKQGWPSAPFYDRQFFLTEDVLDLLKASCIAGGSCERLRTEREAYLYDEMRKRGIHKNPPGSIVYLNGSPPKLSASKRRTTAA